MAKFSAEERRALAAKGVARKDGSYPIRNAQDLQNAYMDYIRTGRPTSVARWIAQRAKALGKPNPISNHEKYRAAISK